VYTRTKETLVTPPAVEPVTLAEAQEHCRVLDNYDDVYLAALITTAREHLENICRRAFVTQTWDYYWDSFEAEMRIPRCPLQSVTSVSYIPDTGSAYITLATSQYEIGVENEISYLRESYEGTWPTTRGHYDDVKVRCVLGYGATAASVPAPIRHAMLLLIGHFYMLRGDDQQTTSFTNTLPASVNHLIAPYRLLEF